MLYLGSVPERTADVDAALDSLQEQPWQFVADIPADRWVTAPGGGRELYCIFAVRREDTLFVYEKQDPQYPHQTGRELYCRQDGQPILLLCNGTPDTPDITAVVYCTTGRALDWSPRLSAGTSSPEPVEGVDDFSQPPNARRCPLRCAPAGHEKGEPMKNLKLLAALLALTIGLAGCGKGSNASSSTAQK